MSTFKANIANFVTTGDTTASSRRRIKNLIECQLNDHRIRIYVNSDVINRRRIGQLTPGDFIKSGCIEIDKIYTASKGKKISEDICWLLSFATMSRVCLWGFEFEDIRKEFSVSGFYNDSRPVLMTEVPGTVKRFLETSWVPYQKLKKTRKLEVLIDYLLSCDKPDTQIEVRCALISIALENLKDTYSRLRSDIYYRKNKQGFYEIGNNKRIGFETLLNDTLRAVNMRRGIKRIIKLRNEILHTGLSDRPLNNLYKKYGNAQDLAREYLLRLLEYRGPYLDYTNACRSLKHIF